MTRVTAIEISILLLALASIAGLTGFVFARRSSGSELQADRRDTPVRTVPSPIKSTAPKAGFTNEAIEAALADIYKLAFGVARVDYQIMDEHAHVLARIGSALDESVHNRDYFPRRPMLLPKLMQALNDPEVSRETLVKLILQDPAIAGGVLQQANSAFYRVSPARVDSIDRAVWLLGTDGLRRLMATAIMQPVFRLPKGYFDAFAPLTWEQAQRAAAAAEAYAKHIAKCDAFVAQLLAALEPLAHIVIFRIGTDQYRDTPNVLPRPEVFIRAMQQHSAQLALKIASAWEMSAVSIDALEDQSQQRPPALMHELGRAVYFARLASSLALLAARRPETQEEEYLAVLAGQGLDQANARLMWVAAVSACETA